MTTPTRYAGVGTLSGLVVKPQSKLGETCPRRQRNFVSLPSLDSCTEPSSKRQGFESDLIRDSVPKARQASRPTSLGEPLCPVGAPPPRPTNPRYKATVAVPSGTISNNFVRIKNCGQALQRRQTMVGDLQDGFPLRCESLPILLPTVALVRTPARAGRLVRSVSTITMGLPSGGSSSSSSPSKAPDVRQHATDSTISQGGETPMQHRATTSKHVMFADATNGKSGEVKKKSSGSRFWPQVFNKKMEGTLSVAEKRSKRLQSSLYELRRINAAHISSDSLASNLPPCDQDDTEEVLLQFTLRDGSDTEAQLRKLEEQLANGQSDAADQGARRHATAVISNRTLAVVRRKASLLQAVEAKIGFLEDMLTKCDELLPRVLDGEAKPPEEFKGIKKFIVSHTHPGNPCEANKSDFDAFAASFRLPPGHQALNLLLDVAQDVGEWWAEACIRHASGGADHAQLRRLFDVAIGSGVVNMDHPKLVRALKILNDRLAERVLHDAEKRLQRDAFRAERRLQVGPASVDADTIDSEIQSAIEEGVPAVDTRLAETRKIAKQLRELDGQRKRMLARQKRLAAADQVPKSTTQVEPLG